MIHKNKKIHTHTDEHTDFSKTVEIFQFHDQICGQSQIQRLIPNSNNKGTYLGHLRKNFEPSFLRPRLTLPTKGQFAISRQTDSPSFRYLIWNKKIYLEHDKSVSQSKETQVSPCNCGKKPCNIHHQEPSE